MFGDQLAVVFQTDPVKEVYHSPKVLFPIFQICKTPESQTILTGYRLNSHLPALQ